MNTRFQISSQRGHCLAVIGDALGPLRQVRTTIKMDLAAGSAWTGLGHPPEVVVIAVVDVAPASHPLRWEADLITPDRPGNLVVRVGRGRQPLGWDPEVPGQEVPRPTDRIALEVIPERPVPEHLEERVVARRSTDLLEVVVLAGDPQDTLIVDRSGVRPRFGTDEHVLELDHAGIGEQEGGVAGRHESGAGHDRVSAFGEELDEAMADLGGGQRHDPWIGGRDG